MGANAGDFTNCAVLETDGGNGRLELRKVDGTRVTELPKLPNTKAAISISATDGRIEFTGETFAGECTIEVVPLNPSGTTWQWTPRIKSGAASKCNKSSTGFALASGS